VRDPIEWDCGVPHRDHDVNDASTNADVFVAPIAEEAGTDLHLGGVTGVVLEVDEGSDLVRGHEPRVATLRIRPTWSTESSRRF
jgi:hypothetical protein